MSATIRRLLALIPIVLWLLSLVLPAAGWGRLATPEPGWKILLLGWLGMLSLQFGWLGNVAILATSPIVLLDYKPSILIVTLLGVGLLVPGAQAVFWQTVDTDIGRMKVTVGPGYYVWLAAVFFQLLALISVSWGTLSEAFGFSPAKENPYEQARNDRTQQG